MSAVVCGKRSSFFEDIPSSPPLTKRIRFSNSPLRYSPPRSTNTGSPSSSISQSPFDLPSISPHLLPLDNLVALFPDMDKQLLARAFEECGDDLDSAIRSLNELRLGSVENLGSATGKPGSLPDVNAEFLSQGKANGETAGAEGPSGSEIHEMDGSDWVELFVREMMNASNMDDARTRASRALEFLEKSICARANAETTQGLQQENIMLKEQLQALVQENVLLKRAVSIQHERQKEFEDKSQELHNLKQMVSQYQEQLRTLEVNNYALTMHLRQAQQSNSISGRFHPDVF